MNEFRSKNLVSETFEEEANFSSAMEKRDAFN